MFKFHVIGIGALNADAILPASAAALLDPDASPEQKEFFDRNTEGPMPRPKLESLLDEIGRSNFHRAHGGSSMLALASLADLELPLQLGFVGVAGSTEGVLDRTFRQELTRLGIDARCVWTSRSPAGLCVSLPQEGDRALGVDPGANVEFPERLLKLRSRVVDYLSQARVIHVSSLFDPVSARVLADILREVKAKSPEARICFDPGNEWCRTRPVGFSRLLRLADYLITNLSEFRLLAGQTADVLMTPNKAKVDARSVLEKCRPDSTVLMLKRYDRVCAYRLEGGADFGVRETCFQQSVLTEPEIQDATGAGDVFASGLIASLVSPQLQVELGALLGMALAREKLGHAGLPGSERFAPITRSFLRNLERELLEQNKSRKVFVAHGQDDRWETVTDTIGAWGLEVIHWEVDPRESRIVPHVVEEMIRGCGAAVILLLGEEQLMPVPNAPKRTRKLEWRARQNVVHELGLAQMFLDPDRVFIVHEEGVTGPSNIQGTVTIRLEGSDGLPVALKKLRRAMRQRGLLG